MSRQVPVLESPQPPSLDCGKLNAEIHRRALTTEAAAGLVGVTVKTMHRWRQGASKPQPRHFRALADAFGREPAWFYLDTVVEEQAA